MSSAAYPSLSLSLFLHHLEEMNSLPATTIISLSLYSLSLSLASAPETFHHFLRTDHGSPVVVADSAGARKLGCASQPWRWFEDTRGKCVKRGMGEKKKEDTRGGERSLETIAI